MRYVIWGFTILFMSCATLGSRTRIYNEGKVQNIKTIGLITKHFNQPRNPYHKIIKESFTRALISELETKNLFKVVILDTMENEQLNINSYVTDAPIDALLLAEWKLAIPQSMVSDAKVKISLLDKETKELLLISKHGTKFGNSYWRVPALPKTLIDAVNGSVATLEKNIRLKE